MTRPLILLTLAAVSCGCAQFSLFTLGAGKKLVEASPKNPVAEVMCLWESAEGNDLNGLPCRGFAGQVLFFTAGHPQSAKIDGDIRIYVFDDLGGEEERSRPIRQFDFDSGSWNTFLRPSDLGASYQLFVPYTRPGKSQANCSLRIRYTPKNGGLPVYSKMASIALAGSARADVDVVRKSRPEGYSDPLPAGAPARTELASGPAGQGVSPSFNLATPTSPEMQQRLSALQSAAAATARQVSVEEPPLDFSAGRFEDASELETRAERRSYRLSQ